MVVIHGIFLGPEIWSCLEASHVQSTSMTSYGYVSGMYMRQSKYVICEIDHALASLYNGLQATHASLHKLKIVCLNDPHLWLTVSCLDFQRIFSFQTSVGVAWCVRPFCNLMVYHSPANAEHLLSPQFDSTLHTDIQKDWRIRFWTFLGTLNPYVFLENSIPFEHLFVANLAKKSTAENGWIDAKTTRWMDTVYLIPHVLCI